MSRRRLLSRHAQHQGVTLRPHGVLFESRAEALECGENGGSVALVCQRARLAYVVPEKEHVIHIGTKRGWQDERVPHRDDQKRAVEIQRRPRVVPRRHVRVHDQTNRRTLLRLAYALGVFGREGEIDGETRQSTSGGV